MSQSAGPAELFLNLFKVPELRKKALFTLMILAVYRLGSTIPVPGIDNIEFAKTFAEQTSSSWVYSFLGIYNALSAGGLTDFTIFSLGIMPYISAEIIFQLLTKVVPKLEEIQKARAGSARFACMRVSQPFQSVSCSPSSPSSCSPAKRTLPRLLCGT